jgi:hypothetical protein
MLKFVVGLFESKGIAEDACHRLRYEGVPPADISLLLMHETAAVPAAMTPELAALEVDPFIVGRRTRELCALYPQRRDCGFREGAFGR